MKYIKTYEIITDENIADEYKDYHPINNPKYKVGDYVLLNSELIREEYPLSRYEDAFVYYNNYGLIVGEPKPLGKDNFMYDTKAINEETMKLEEIAECYISENRIIRKLTPDEIEEFETVIQQSKYNL